MLTPAAAARAARRGAVITATERGGHLLHEPCHGARRATVVRADKKGIVRGLGRKGNAKTRMGHRLEPIIIASMVEEHGWKLRRQRGHTVDAC